MAICRICGNENCQEHFYKFNTKKITSFSGSSPPEVFVGRWNYPNVYTGILSPQNHGNTEILSSPELWHKSKLSIKEINNLRNKLIYGRTENNIKNVKGKFTEVMHEVAMTHKSVSASFQLKKPVASEKKQDSYVPLISKAAPIEKVKLEESPKIKSKVEYIVNDTDAKATEAIKELQPHASVSHIIKLLSAGLLGLGTNRKMVPTRWAITATDDSLSKDKISRIKYYKQLQEIQLFHSYYVGNNYHFLLIPGPFAFEVIEISSTNKASWQDYETHFGRKKYASSVTGAYYSNRLALTEYLEKIGRQCQCIVFREIRPEYNVPLGVGILREASREAFSKPAIKFQETNQALQEIQKNLTIPISLYTNKSKLLEERRKQSRLSEFIR